MSEGTLVMQPDHAALGTLQPGDVIAEKYELEREVGRGAMGTVWAAFHRTLGQRVAIKLISPEHVGSPDARRRFSVEAKAAARLRSRHVVQVQDDGETASGTPYIVMEYLEGETLEQRLAHTAPLPLPDAVRIASHVGRALARAHAQGVVHRDLKSGNIFIARSDDDDHGWIAKVLDFGVAKFAEMRDASTTKTGTIVGTPLFMSPEQVRGAAHVDHRADLYSLGIVFFHMVTGRFAFNGPSYSDVLVAICTEPLPDIRELAPGLPEPLRVWFRRACARAPEDRYQSADEMVEALQEAAGAAGRVAYFPGEEPAPPSRTVVGHVPPHEVGSIDRVSTPNQSGDTLRSTPRLPPNVDARTDIGTLDTQQPPREPVPLWVWGAAGVAAAVLVVLIGFFASAEPDPAPQAEPNAATMEAAPAAMPTPAAPEVTAAAPAVTAAAAAPAEPPVVTPTSSAAIAVEPEKPRALVAKPAVPPATQPRALPARLPPQPAPSPAPTASPPGTTDIGF
jgi:serine/threonine protein kinase